MKHPLQVTHSDKLSPAHVAELIASRGWNVQGVEVCEVVSPLNWPDTYGQMACAVAEVPYMSVRWPRTAEEQRQALARTARKPGFFARLFQGWVTS